MLYLTHADIHDPFFYVDTGTKKLIFLNNLEIDAFNERNQTVAFKAVAVGQLLEEARALSGDTALSNKLALILFRKYDVLHKSIAVSTHFPLAMAEYLRSHGATLVIKEPFILEREQKSVEEVAHIRESIRRTCTAFECIEDIIRESAIKDDFLLFQGRTLTSEYIKKRVDEILIGQDMENSEGFIISCGQHAAMPHHRGAGFIRPNQTIVCDIFPRNRTSGYFADMTRTYVKGSPTKQVRKMYNAVRDSQDEAIKVLKSGMLAKDAYAVSVKVIQDAGFDVGERGYMHGLGHGLGLDVHEVPFLNQHTTAVLKVGNIVTVEPGLYYPEWGGVRLEDVVVVTENSCENLTNYERELVIP